MFFTLYSFTLREHAQLPSVRKPYERMGITSHPHPPRRGVSCSCACPLTVLSTPRGKVSSPHLARSYHHLFPVPHFEENTAAAAAAAAAGSSGEAGGEGTVEAEVVSCVGCLRDLAESASYRCPECKSTFCLDCDMYVHDSLHNCPGCC